ncbi:MAG: helix-turn-helix domain-containing protein [Acidobacteria bacterium]|nr:helix-turn-helix domain-containing protein [Acidobacteriota bacterium]
MPRRVLLKLTEADRQALMDEVVRTSDENVRRACKALLKLSEGKGRKEVATAIKVHPTTVGRWAAQFRRHGLKGLAGSEAAPRGRPPKLRGEHLDLLCKAAQTVPRDLGKSFARWTLQRLTRHFAQQTGLGIRPQHVGFLLRRAGINWSQTGEKATVRFSGVSQAAVLWFTVAALASPKSASAALPPRVLLVAMNLGDGQLTGLWTEGRTPAAFIRFLERLLEQHPQQKLVLVAETGSIRLTKGLNRFLESQGRRLEIGLVSSHSERQKEPEPVRRSKKTIQFLFNSPERLVTRIRKGIQLVEAQDDHRLKHDFLSK